MKYSLSGREIPRAEPQGFPEGEVSRGGQSMNLDPVSAHVKRFTVQLYAGCFTESAHWADSVP